MVQLPAPQRLGRRRRLPGPAPLAADVPPVRQPERAVRPLHVSEERGGLCGSTAALRPLPSSRSRRTQWLSGPRSPRPPAHLPRPQVPLAAAALLQDAGAHIHRRGRATELHGRRHVGGVARSHIVALPCLPSHAHLPAPPSPPRSPLPVRLQSCTWTALGRRSSTGWRCPAARPSGACSCSSCHCRCCCCWGACVFPHCCPTAAPQLC